MKPLVRLSVLAGVTAFVAAASAMAQAPVGVGVGVSTGGTAQFRDEKTGKIWTPENVSKDNQTSQQQAAKPVTPADKAFDPSSQNVPVQVVTQRPQANLMGKVPVTAGPTVPIVTLDGPSLQALPNQTWLTVLYITNNSANVIDPVIGCTFTNGGRPVQDTRVVAPAAGPGERWGVPVYGPRVEIFVDRVTCRVLSPI